MNLLAIRKLFLNLSGRYDLVNPDGSDNGATFFINEASKWLDRTIEVSKSTASYMAILSPGTWAVRVPFVRAIKEVWVTTASGKVQLEKKRMEDLLAWFYRMVPGEWSNGVPRFYSPTISRYIPENVSPATLTTFAQYIGVMTNIDYDYDAFIISRPVAENTLFEVFGLFYSRLLEADEDENYWSRNSPMLLVQTTIRQTCLTNGNKPLLDSIDRGIDGDLTRLDKDIVEQEISEIDQMEG